MPLPDHTIVVSRQELSQSRCQRLPHRLADFLTRLRSFARAKNSLRISGTLSFR